MAGETHSGTGYEEAASSAFPPFDFSTFPSQIFWLVLTFGVMYVVLSRVILPKMENTLARRADQIAGDLDQAAKLTEEVAAVSAASERRMAEARARARDLAAKARSEADVEIARATDQADIEIGNRLSAATARLSQARTEALANVGSIALETAPAIVQRLTGAKVTATQVKAAAKKVLA
jgi:F-type H+-transporting ATPase subunit b